jgi:hypothetical protein
LLLLCLLFLCTGKASGINVFSHHYELTCPELLFVLYHDIVRELIIGIVIVSVVTLEMIGVLLLELIGPRYPFRG